MHLSVTSNPYILLISVGLYEYIFRSLLKFVSNILFDETVDKFRLSLGV